MQNGCDMNPSATSPATSVIPVPTPASQIGGGPKALTSAGSGMNIGVMRVFW
ncbi:Uncharacterised protein [Mycobacteroides abscessus subsp. abscessus]|nr:Uncharacterised protein [Mycobacteroides abscessus subsp. abscessus]SKU67024.1 Uncharacterised protein [Mycobacteroides abscessus subsp. abscessus]SLC85588.1 Uncharacterised protein [Mycobacteroides abscessus subsp. massiliense]